MVQISKMPRPYAILCHDHQVTQSYSKDSMASSHETCCNDFAQRARMSEL